MVTEAERGSMMTTMFGRIARFFATPEPISSEFRVEYPERPIVVAFSVLPR